MKFVSALVGLTALCGVALSGAAASAMPVAIPARAPHASKVQRAALVCHGGGHCWHQPGYGDGYGDGYFHPHYYGGWGWHRWHHWHHGWGYGRHYWHRWHHGWRYWHQW
jgi:hypothetical protein